MGTESDDYTDTEGTYQEVVAGDDRPDHVKQRGPPKVVSHLHVILITWDEVYDKTRSIAEG